MPRKNFISLHEAIGIALLYKPNRTSSFQEIWQFIVDRSLCPNREGNVDIATQVMLRATKAKGAYYHSFEEVGTNVIRLRNFSY